MLCPQRRNSRRGQQCLRRRHPPLYRGRGPHAGFPHLGPAHNGHCLGPGQQCAQQCDPPLPPRDPARLHGPAHARRRNRRRRDAWRRPLHRRHPAASEWILCRVLPRSHRRRGPDHGRSDGCAPQHLARNGQPCQHQLSLPGRRRSPHPTLSHLSPHHLHREPDRTGDPRPLL